MASGWGNGGSHLVPLPLPPSVGRYWIPAYAFPFPLRLSRATNGFSECEGPRLSNAYFMPGEIVAMAK